ncbi:hypothetical protein CEXT_277071 [Caerostris extrusa]|uniref:Uncharacterized protein n=1 Tax=Caerostris extrusa TaxID=172846 RepID=A0AAV4WJF8_CAEEX|nr:hypothetical protein CEXT_277071 [Caerostris extrusa]
MKKKNFLLESPSDLADNALVSEAKRILLRKLKREVEPKTPATLLNIRRTLKGIGKCRQEFSHPLTFETVNTKQLKSVKRETPTCPARKSVVTLEAGERNLSEFQPWQLKSIPSTEDGSIWVTWDVGLRLALWLVIVSFNPQRVVRNKYCERALLIIRHIR